VRNLPEFKALINRWKLKFDRIGAISMPAHIEDAKITGTYRIPFKLHRGGTYEVESKVNGLPLNMTFDTGASDISISQTEVDFMIKNGYLSDRDYVGTQIYNMANGMDEESKTILLKRVEIGGLVLQNVFASIVDNREAGMLFGQSAMGRFATITIDNQKKQIIISGPGK
jgi:aspartyl protease family protein